MNFLCKIGIHKKKCKQVFVPSIYAKIVTEYDFSVYCQRCKKVIRKDHNIWNGTTFVKI